MPAPLTAPVQHLYPRHDSNTTLTVAVVSAATTQVTVSSGAIFGDLPCEVLAVRADGATELLSVDSLSAGTTYNVTRGLESGVGGPAALASLPIGTTLYIIAGAEVIRRLQQAALAKGAHYHSVLEYGVRADGQVRYDAAITASSPTLTSASAPFVAADVGKRVVLVGAAASGATLTTTIASVGSATTVTLATPAVRTVVADSGAPGYQVGDGVVFWGTDDTVALQAAIDSFPQDPSDSVFQLGHGQRSCRGGTLVFPPSLMLLTATLNWRSNLRGQGVFGGYSAGGAGSYESGTWLVWAAGAGTLVDLTNCHHVVLDGLNCMGAAIAGTTGLLIDAYSAPTNWATNASRYENCGFYDLIVGIQWGASAVNDYQHDGTAIRNCQFRNLLAAGRATARGIVINSANSQQYSVIEQCIFQLCNIGIDVQETGGIAAIRQCSFGAVVYGTTPADVKLATVYDILLENLHGEGGRYLVWVVGPPNNQGAITLIGCAAANDAIQIDRTAHIVSLGGRGEANASAVLNDPGAIVVSIGDRYTVTGAPGAPDHQGWTITQGRQYKLDAGGLLLGGGTFTTAPFSTSRIWKKLSTSAVLSFGTMNTTTAIEVERDVSLAGVDANAICTATPEGGLDLGLVVAAVFVPVPGTVRIRLRNESGGTFTVASRNWRVVAEHYG
ncbi:MAG TPA: hypothetical protein VFA62_03850 [Acidimicrobiia bacterium]|nr:hypothetical protein [Acidimicrobiia bacterium]